MNITPEIQRMVLTDRVLDYEQMITPQCYVHLTIAGSFTAVEAERLVALIRAAVPVEEKKPNGA